MQLQGTTGSFLFLPSAPSKHLYLVKWQSVLTFGKAPRQKEPDAGGHANVSRVQKGEAGLGVRVRRRDDVPIRVFDAVCGLSPQRQLAGPPLERDVGTECREQEERRERCVSRLGKWVQHSPDENSVEYLMKL